MINVLEMLEKTAEAYPSKLALADENSSINYYDYLLLAKKIGTSISSLLKKKINQNVVVFIDRNIESIITFMGVLYSGNTYVPVDMTQPESRIQEMLGTVNPAIVIFAHEAVEYDCLKEYTVVKYEELIFNEINDEQLQVIRDTMIDYDPAYIMFTSGSTGVPKGIAVSHRSIIDLIIQFHDAFELNDTSIFANQAPFDFDVSVKDIYNAMYSGGTIHIVPKRFFSSPPMLLEFLNEKEINTLVWATSALRIIENFDSFTVKVPKFLRLVMFSGEVMPTKVLNYWKQYLPSVTFVNLYGPTEITCNCSYYKVDRNFSNEDVLPVGKPFPNTRILLLDLETDELLEDFNRIGEICVVGTSLALGYYANEEQTSKSFVNNPCRKGFKELMYRTGDIGYWNEYKELMFVSRKDSQIKHMGHRIELTEIEHRVLSIEHVMAAFCYYHEERIYLFYTANEEMNRYIKTRLLEYLPKYMVPNKIVFKESMPLNKNNKIDRKKIINEHFKLT